MPHYRWQIAIIRHKAVQGKMNLNSDRFPEKNRMIANARRNCDDTYDDNDDSFGTKTDIMG